MLHKLKYHIRIAILAVIALIIFGTIAYRFLEGWSWVTSFYFAVTTLTTVGYGELYPTTEASQIFTAFFILAGVSITLAAISIVAMEYMTKMEKKIVKETEKKTEKMEEKFEEKIEEQLKEKN